ncbi:hypothetical protein P280DRAFT_465174 [Massarina eburnea CBS 473.64]|uniref:Rhodopsin domain-containing protein n=1 Tax=Massarina eburnea CBS 473.64 TaxID=1395130 RepID=A0A6A6SBY1_9PLEO|nr:hypothetical protein P280DRAFT_465174 [Massarina eburnea CBS 473.64]
MATDSTATGTVLVGMIPAPVGVEPDFSGKSTEMQHKLIVINIVMTILSTFVLVIRLYTRQFLSRSIGLDDLLIVMSWGGCIAWVGVQFGSFQYGFGDHMWNVTAMQLQGYLGMLIGIGLVYVWQPALAKLSLLVMYHRLSPSRWNRFSCYAMAILILGYSIAFTIIVIWPCNPLHGNIECLSQLNLTMAIFNIITDAIIIALPVPMLHSLHLPLKQRVGLGVVFAIGSGVMITSIVRIIYVYQWIANVDATYYQGNTCIFSTVEMNAGIICTSIVLLKPFVARFFPTLLFNSSNNTGNRTPSGNLSKSWGGKKKTGGMTYELQSKGNDYNEYLKGDKVGVTVYGPNGPHGNREIGDGESTIGIINPAVRSDRVHR